MNNPLGQIRERFAKLDEQFRERSVRERTVLALGLAASLFMALDTTLLQPIGKRLTQTRVFTAESINEIADLEEERRALGRAELTEEERRLWEEKRALMQEVQRLDEKIAAQISELVPPEAVISVLENMLEEDPRLRLVSLRSEQPHRVGSNHSGSPEAQVAEETSGVFLHGLHLEIEADYRATVDYLRRVEASPWHLLWDRIDYRVSEYPKAHITIDIHTISEDEAWIGV